MGRKMWGALAAAALTINSVPAVAQQVGGTAGLTPSDKWIANFDNESCALMRAFGTGDQQVNLMLRPVPQNPLLQVVIMYHKQFDMPMLMPGQPSPAAQLTLLPSGNVVKGEYHDMPLPPGTFGYQKMLQFYFPRDELAELGDAKTLKFDARPAQVTLQPSALAAAMKTLADCEDDLVKSWGYDPAALHGLSKRALPATNASLWLKKSDYNGPKPAMGFNLRAGLRYKVDEQGAVSDCHVIQSSGTAQFDETACTALMKRAKYKPALDKDSKPVASLVTANVSLPLF